MVWLKDSLQSAVTRAREASSLPGGSGWAGQLPWAGWSFPAEQ